MEYRKLPHGDEQISIIGMGNSSLGASGEGEAEKTVAMALENGINYFGENQEWVKFVGTFDKDYSGGWINGEGTMWYSDGRVVTGIWEGTTLIEEFSSEQTDPALIRAEAEAARADFFADPIFGEAGL